MAEETGVKVVAEEAEEEDVAHHVERRRYQVFPKMAAFMNALGTFKGEELARLKKVVLAALVLAKTGEVAAGMVNI